MESVSILTLVRISDPKSNEFHKFTGLFQQLFCHYQISRLYRYSIFGMFVNSLNIISYFVYTVSFISFFCTVIQKIPLTLSNWIEFVGFKLWLSFLIGDSTNEMYESPQKQTNICKEWTEMRTAFQIWASCLIWSDFISSFILLFFFVFILRHISHPLIK